MRANEVRNQIVTRFTSWLAERMVKRVERIAIGTKISEIVGRQFVLDFLCNVFHFNVEQLDHDSRLSTICQLQLCRKQEIALNPITLHEIQMSSLRHTQNSMGRKWLLTVVRATGSIAKKSRRVAFEGKEMRRDWLMGRNLHPIEVRFISLPLHGKNLQKKEESDPFEIRNSSVLRLRTLQR